MRVIVVGATGTIGRAIVEALEARHEVVPVSHSRGRHRVDLAAPESIASLFEKIGSVDAVVNAAGLATFGALSSLTEDDFLLGLRNKLMGQVNLVRLGLSHVADGGSFTLTSGVLGRRPTPGSAAISVVNAGLEGFVRAAALEMPRSIRINVVSPPWLSETLKALGRDASQGMPAAVVARAYVESVEGSASGSILDPA
jgi:NAD(P)-dependent dehydrogenase (short-subunit alcohol dehydrogenase family)